MQDSADFKTFLEAGASIYEWMCKAGMMHAKTAIFDDEIARVGSFNFDKVSFKSNLAALTLVRGQEGMEEMKNIGTWQENSNVVST